MHAPQAQGGVASCCKWYIVFKSRLRLSHHADKCNSWAEWSNRIAKSGRQGNGFKLPKSQILRSEWKTGRVREDASGDIEDGEEDDDELPCVISESEGDCIWRGSRSSVEISYHREQVTAHRKKIQRIKYVSWK